MDESVLLYFGSATVMHLSRHGAALNVALSTKLRAFCTSLDGDSRRKLHSCQNIEQINLDDAGRW